MPQKCFTSNYLDTVRALSARVVLFTGVCLETCGQLNLNLKSGFHMRFDVLFLIFRIELNF